MALGTGNPLSLLPVITHTFLILTVVSLFSCIFPLLDQDFQISNAEPFIILLAPSVSLEITMGLGIFTCYSLYNLLKLISSLVKELI